MTHLHELRERARRRARARAKENLLNAYLAATVFGTLLFCEGPLWLMLAMIANLILAGWIGIRTRRRREGESWR